MKDMDAKYICEHLLKLGPFWYHGEPFAKYSERRGVYIFGSIDGDTVHKNIVTKACAIYLIIGGGDIEKRMKKK